MEYKKVCVEVIARFSEKGGVFPMELFWPDGTRFSVDRVRSVERAPARVNAVLPVRYTCVIRGREKFLYFEPDHMRWFVEVKQ